LLEKKILFHHNLTAEDLYHHPDGGEDVECDVLGHVHRPDTNSPSFEVEISFPDASIVKIEGQLPPFGSYMMKKFFYTSINIS
jgi:hypothetical protein